MDSKKFLTDFIMALENEHLFLDGGKDTLELYADKLDELVADEVARELEEEQRSNL